MKNDFNLNYNVTGAERKRLVQAISDYTGASAKYLGAPSFAYEVDYFTIDRNGVVSFDSRADSEEIEGLIETLEERGFTAQDSDADPEEPEEDGLVVSVPIKSVNMDNLTKLLEAKGTLIKHALGIEDLPIRVSEDEVTFAWFSELPKPDEAMAYFHLIAALCEMSRNQNRVTATEKDIDNEKYAFRCFLLRLGFIGEKFKAERKILLRNLKGSSAFKSGQKGGCEHEVSE